MPIARLDHSVIRLSGEGVTDWLSGLISNSLDQAINFAALLTPQGKIIADFFAINDGDDWLLDTPMKFSDILIKRLRLYRLRAKIDIEPLDYHVYGSWGAYPVEGLNALADPRHPELGFRIITESPLEITQDDAKGEAHSLGDYDAHRLSLGIVDSQHDFDSSQIFPADANMDLIGGIDFKKGCYVGQEVVSRMKRKTEVRKRMRSFSFQGALSGTDIKAGERVVGQVLHSHNGLGMALVRLDRLASSQSPTKVGDIFITIE